MIPWILAVLALWVVQTFLAASFNTVFAPEPSAATLDHMKGKDHKPEPTKLGGRAERARNNMLEALPVFLAIALLLQIQGDASTLAQAGAAVFLGARILYIPAYLVAIMGVRTLVWAGGWVGLGLMIAALFM